MIRHVPFPIIRLETFIRREGHISRGYIGVVTESETPQGGVAVSVTSSLLRVASSSND